MSKEYSNISIKEIERENRLKRIKEAKDLDKKWSKKVVEANRENELQKKQKEEYIGAIELVRSINQQIAELQRDKDIYIKKQEESEIEKEKEKQMKYENMIREQEKKKQFDLFIKKKGIEASNYIRNEKEEEDRKYEELHRCEKKKQTKYEENIKTKKVIDNFLIKKEKEINEEKLNALNPNTMDVLYKITNPFHNHGNKIDYSTTRFHNVTIERHDNNLKDEINLKINAFERAKIEAENTKNKLNEKKNKLKEFKKNEKINYREQINKNRAKENLEKLNNEIQQFNKMKKGDKNIAKKRIDINANINNAKQNEKKAEHMMNKLLENQKGNRGKIYGENKLQIVTNKKSENEQKISDDSLNNFYKDKNDNYEINEQNILEQNEIEDDNYIQNKNKKRVVKKYEEPIVRDKIPKKEVINRLSPIDLPAYQKVELEDKNEFEHREPKNKNQMFILNKKEKNVNKYYLEDIPTKVNDFNLLNELQINNNNNFNNNNYINNEMNDVKLFINQMNSNNPKINYENNFINSDKAQEKPNNIKNIDIMNNNNNKLEEEKKKKDENKDKKWKYNKQELYERKKKMLKDKSNFK